MAIEVATAEDLYNVRNDLSADYIQVADIDLSGYSNWEPIGGFDSWSNAFGGSYDGQGYTISNLTAIHPDKYNVGLFGYVDSDVYAGDTFLRNINLENVEIEGNYYVGGLLGNNWQTDITNCHIDNITLKVNSGESGAFMGALNSMDFTTYITDCSVKGQIIPGSDPISGIYNIGGFTYENWYKSHFKRCFAEVDILFSDFHTDRIGGFISSNEDPSIIEECYRIGEVMTGEYSSYTMGFSSKNDWAVCKNCFHIGDVQGGGYVAGFATNIYGTEEDNGPGIENCYCVGEITGDTNLGPFTTDSYSYGEIIGAYYNKDIANVPSVGKATGLTTQEMKDKNNYINWDFNNVWYIYPTVNDGYPVLEEHEVDSTTTIYFIEPPSIKQREVKANRVIVKSPEAEYTAETPSISEDNRIERLVTIEEGGVNVCKQVAESLLEEWSRKKVSITGKIKLNQGIKFEKEVYLIVPEGNINKTYKVQKLNHDVDNYTTSIIAGDLILSDSELLARILEKIL